MTQEAEQVIITTGVTDASPRPNPIDNNAMAVQEQVIGILTHHNSSSAIKTAVNSQQVQDLPSRLVETDPNPTPSAAHLMQHEQALFGADQTSTIAPPMSIGHTEVVVLDTPNMSLMPPDGHSLTHEGTPYFLAPTAGLTMSSAMAGGGGKSAGGSGSSLLATGSPKDWLVGSEKEKQAETNNNDPTNHRAKMEGLSVPHKSQSVRGATTSGFPTSAMSPLIGPTSQGEEEREGRSSPQRRSPDKSRRDYPDDAEGSRRRRHHRHHRGRSRSYSPSRGSREHRHRRTAGGGTRRSRSPRSARSRSASYSSRGSSGRSPRHRQRHSREYDDDASRQSSLRHRYKDDDRGRHRHHRGGGGGRQSERFDDGPSTRGSRRYDDRGDDRDDDWSHSRRHSGRGPRRSGHDRRQDDDLYDDRRGAGRRSHHGGDGGGSRKDRSPPKRYDHEDSRRSKRARFEDNTVDRPHTSHRHSQGGGGGSRKSQGGGGGDRSGRNTSSRKDLDAELAAYKR